MTDCCNLISWGDSAECCAGEGGVVPQEVQWRGSNFRAVLINSQSFLYAVTNVLDKRLWVFFLFSVPRLLMQRES